jgi:hypothetical protein
VVPLKPFVALVTLCKVSYASGRIFIVFCMVDVVFETFACSCPATGKVFKDLLPALPVLG